ncbi:hypothetical protein GQ607_011616 [Colletotrichum asianum]|uniref:Uncharacterized protein n=1 Tax=Colletotrichum asianum TaxID=702518 RepID=A0A8H3W2L8_9PEZI|nr:hypothetical protein GQ607_011616 [Colletotrichum asianum]
MPQLILHIKLPPASHPPAVPRSNRSPPPRPRSQNLYRRPHTAPNPPRTRPRPHLVTPVPHARRGQIHRFLTNPLPDGESPNISCHHPRYCTE